MCQSAHRPHSCPGDAQHGVYPLTRNNRCAHNHSIKQSLVLYIRTKRMDSTLAKGLGVLEWLARQGEGARLADVANVLIGAAGVHALAAIVMGRLERVNLVAAMLTGVKRFR